MSSNEFNDIKQLEVITFRRCILSICQDTIADRDTLLASDLPTLALYKYPPNIETKAEPPEHVRAAIRECKSVILYSAVSSPSNLFDEPCCALAV